MLSMFSSFSQTYKKCADFNTRLLKQHNKIGANCTKMQLTKMMFV